MYKNKNQSGNKSHYTHKEDSASFIVLFFKGVSIVLLLDEWRVKVHVLGKWVNCKIPVDQQQLVWFHDSTVLYNNVRSLENKESLGVAITLPLPPLPHHCWLYCRDLTQRQWARGQRAELPSFLTQQVATLTEYLLGILLPWWDVAFGAASQWGHRTAAEASAGGKRLCVSAARSDEATPTAEHLAEKTAFVSSEFGYRGLKLSYSVINWHATRV